MSRRRLWCVVPAGGVGRRLGEAVPKQFLPLAGRSVLWHAVAALRAVEPRAIVVVMAAATTPPGVGDLGGPPVEAVLAAGAERMHTVLAGLDHLAARAADDDWVLVHDAARPCVRPEQVRALLAAVADHPQGGLLALPVTETVKRATADAGGTERPIAVGTEDRERLWLAQTPQVFRFARLREALQRAVATGVTATDEAGAVEALGDRPLLVEGSAGNLKVTRPGDLELAAYWLATSGGGSRGDVA